MNKFLVALLKAYPVASVDPDLITFDEHDMDELVNWVTLLTGARAPVECVRDKYGHEEPISASPREGPWRMVQYAVDIKRLPDWLHPAVSVGSVGPPFRTGCSRLTKPLRSPF